MDNMNRLVITMGDPCGVGPELVVKFFDELYKIEDKNLFVAVAGTKSILQKYIEKLHCDLEIVEITEEEGLKMKMENGKIPLFNIGKGNEEFELGKHSSLGGEYCIKYIDKAIELCSKHYFDGMVTCPISKDSINMAGYKFSGHTTYLAAKTDTDDYAMILKGNKVTVLLNTTHLSLVDACKQVTKENILKKIKIADRAKKELGFEGTIAVAGLNPHNGENGLFGREEIEEIEPAVKEAKAMGIDVEGPIVPDTLFVKVMKGQYVMSVVMYHDQGLIPMKMESFGMGVNITIGLPFVRTSVDHGTAFDIVGKGIADTGSLKEAIKTAGRMVKIKKGQFF